LSDLLTSTDLPILLSAISFGFLSSLHCGSMCGPLVCQSSDSPQGHIFYQIGRFLSYQALGFILYNLSSSIFSTISKSLQEYSLYLLIFIYLYMGLKILLNKSGNLVSFPYFSTLYKVFIKKIFKQKNKNKIPFLLGTISALLPCGLLHAFLLGVIPLRSPFVVFLYISCFWLSTTPILLGINLSLRRVKKNFIFNSPKVLGCLYLILGGYLIYVRHIGILESKSCH
jgi:uncharacterized protein